MNDILTSKQLRADFRYLFPDELPALKALARLLPPNPCVVNIGSGAGTSGLAFMESRPDLQLCTIDVQDADSPYGCLYAERQVMERSGFGDDPRWMQIHNDSILAGNAWRAGLVDMVFIDGNHSYKGCRGDVEAWLPNLKSGGILAIHDYNKASVIAKMDYNPDTMPYYKAWAGVNKVIGELLSDSRVELIEIVDTLISFMVVRQ